MHSQQPPYPFLEDAAAQLRMLRAVRGIVADAADRARAARTVLQRCSVDRMPRCVLTMLAQAERAEHVIADDMAACEGAIDLGVAMLRHYGKRLVDETCRETVDVTEHAHAAADFVRMLRFAGVRWYESFNDTDPNAVCYLSAVATYGADHAQTAACARTLRTARAE